jgi:hypothetical protein
MTRLLSVRLMRVGSHDSEPPPIASICLLEGRGDRVTLEVVDHGLRLGFSFADLMRYHGPSSPGGVAHAYKVLERSLPLLAPDGAPERREITVRTAFSGPGARDAFELVLRAVTGERYTVDPTLARPDRGRAAERFVFVLACREREVTLAVSDGFVTDEFVDLARTESRTPEQESRLTVLKAEMAERVVAAPADAVYSAECPPVPE